MSEPTWTAKMFDENKRLKATITSLTKALDTIADYDTDEGDVARAALKEKTS